MLSYTPYLTLLLFQRQHLWPSAAHLHFKSYRNQLFMNHFPFYFLSLGDLPQVFSVIYFTLNILKICESVKPSYLSGSSSNHT